MSLVYRQTDHRKVPGEGQVSDLHGRTMNIDPNKMVMRTMLVDPTEGMINQRFLLALIMILNEGSDGTEKQRFELTNLIFTTGLKLTAVHGHIKRYGEIEDRLLSVSTRSILQIPCIAPELHAQLAPAVLAGTETRRYISCLASTL
jgi:hypothetical protein